MKGKFYREKKYRCGEFTDVYIYPVYPVGKPAPGRKQKKRPTREVQQKLNRRHSEEKLARLLHRNFTEDDLAITLTWAENPTSEEDAKRQVRNYLARLRRWVKKQGGELKYIWSLEVSGRGRYHVHMVLPNMDRDKAEKLWGHGWANTKRLQPDDSGLVALARYMTKSHREEDEVRATYRSYNCSKNLIDPPPEVSDSRIRSQKKAQELADLDMNTWLDLYPDSEVSDLWTFHRDDSGNVYIFARLRNIGHRRRT